MALAVKDSLSAQFNDLVLEQAAANDVLPTDLNDEKLLYSKFDSYYGTLPSEYGTLKPEAVSLLEKIILLYGLRSFQKTQALFDNFAAEEKYHPVVVFEHALMHLKQWTFLDGAEVLEEALSWAQANVKGFEKPGIYTLLRIFQGIMDSLTKGDFTKGRDSMREVRRWLIDVPLSKYTDVQV